jgi:hypothetical protein
MDSTSGGLNYFKAVKVENKIAKYLGEMFRK